MNTRWSVLGVLAIVGLSAAQPPATSDGEAKRLIGTWSMTSLEVEGKKLPKEFIDEVALRITFSADGKYKFTAANETADSGNYRVDAAKTPKEIDLFAANDKGATETFRGIYAIDGDTLTTCLPNLASSPRPTMFETSATSNTRTMTLRIRKE